MNEESSGDDILDDVHGGGEEDDILDDVLGEGEEDDILDDCLDDFFSDDDDDGVAGGEGSTEGSQGVAKGSGSGTGGGSGRAIGDRSLSEALEPFTPQKRAVFLRRVQEDMILQQAMPGPKPLASFTARSLAPQS